MTDVTTPAKPEPVDTEALAADVTACDTEACRAAPTRLGRMRAYVLCRLKQPRTWAGLAVAFAFLGAQIGPEALNAVTFIGTFLAGLVSAGFGAF